MTQSKGSQELEWHQCANSAPLKFVVMASPTGANLRLRHVASQRSQPTKSVNPNNLGAEMKEIRDAALATWHN